MERLKLFPPVRNFLGKSPNYKAPVTTAGDFSFFTTSLDIRRLSKSLKEINKLKNMFSFIGFPAGGVEHI